MSHHSDEPFERAMKKLGGKNLPKLEVSATQNQLMRQLTDVTGFKGALGTFPEGQIVPHDEGAIQFAVGSEGDKVIIDFGTSVKWIGMTAQEAADLASTILAAARKVGRKNGETVALVLGKS